MPNAFKSGGTCPLCPPVPTSMSRRNCYGNLVFLICLVWAYMDLQQGLGDCMSFLAAGATAKHYSLVVFV